jgi:hypothetical protein
MDLYIDPALPIGLSKMVYLLTIPWGVYVWWRSLRLRRYNHIIKVLFVVQSCMLPIYSVYAFCYVYNIAYTATMGYFGWACINFILFGTDAMMASALYSVLRKRNRQAHVVSKLRQRMRDQRRVNNRLW